MARGSASIDVATGRVAASVGLDGVLLGSGITDNAADGLEVSPDGSTLAVAEADEIVLRDAESLIERARLRGHIGPRPLAAVLARRDPVGVGRRGPHGDRLGPR